VEGNKEVTIRTSLFWVITQRLVAVSYRHVGKTYLSHLMEL